MRKKYFSCETVPFKGPPRPLMRQMWPTLTGGGGRGVSRQVRPYILIGLHTLTLTHPQHQPNTVLHSIHCVVV
jgi:hypothetical protein